MEVFIVIYAKIQINKTEVTIVIITENLFIF